MNKPKPLWYAETELCVEANLHQMQIGKTNSLQTLNRIMAHIQTKIENIETKDNLQKEKYLFEIVEKTLDWQEIIYTREEIADLVMLDLINIK